MNEKKPIYKTAYPLAIILLIGGCVVASIVKSNQFLQLVGGFALIAAVPLFIVSIISAIKHKTKNRKKLKDVKVETDLNQVQSKSDNSLSVVQIDNSSIEPPVVLTNKPQYKNETHKVAGVSYRQKEIQSLATYNSGYDMTKKEIEEIYGEYERVNQYEFDVKNAELVPEPDNEYGSNAIKVVADGVHIGYIKSGSASHVKKLIDNNLIKEIKIEIGGGKSKMLYEDGSLMKDEIGYFARVILKTIRDDGT